jgi:hypothetical protein
MADGFTEQDLDTPTEADLALDYGSQYLSTGDIGDRKIRTKIVKVRRKELHSNDGKKRMRAVIYLEGLDKGVVLNATNKSALASALGKDPAGWANSTVGIFVDPNVPFAGKLVKGLRLRVLFPPAAAKPVAKPERATNEWPEEKGDPGADPSMADFEPAK